MSVDIDQAGFSRSGTTHPLGPFDAQLERINMHAQTIDILRGMAARKGLNLSEFVRLHIESVAYGVDGMQRMQADHLRRILTSEGA